MTYRIEIRFNIPALTPNRLASTDVGELIAAIETMLQAIIARDNPTLKLGERDVIISLAQVKSGSSAFEMTTELDSVVEPAYKLATHAITTKNFNRLPSRSVEAIKVIRKFSKTYSAPAELWELNGRDRQLAVVLPSTEIKAEEAGYIFGDTTLYGFLTGVAGESPPRATLRLLDGTSFSCNVTEKNSLEVARQLGQRLYTEVGVRGNARWEYRDNLVLDYFLIEELTEFTPIPIEQALDALHDLAGEDYAAVDDIDALVNELRGRDEDDE